MSTSDEGSAFFRERSGASSNGPSVMKMLNEIRLLGVLAMVCGVAVAPGCDGGEDRGMSKAMFGEFKERMDILQSSNRPVKPLLASTQLAR